MGFKLTPKDRANLKGVHPDLIRVVERAAELSTIVFRVGEGLRSIEQQRKNVAKGVSWTMNSRHLTGHAVDLIPMVDVNSDGKITTAEQFSWPIYYKLAPVIKAAAKAEKVPIEWGGDWTKSKDGPHWQLPFKLYPVAKPKTKAAKAVALATAGSPEATHTTEQERSAQQSVGIASGGVVTGGAIGGEPIVSAVVDAATGQQDQLSSGDVAKIVVAILIIALVVGYAIWRHNHKTAEPIT